MWNALKHHAVKFRADRTETFAKNREKPDFNQLNYPNELINDVAQYNRFVR